MLLEPLIQSAYVTLEPLDLIDASLLECGVLIHQLGEALLEAADLVDVDLLYLSVLLLHDVEALLLLLSHLGEFLIVFLRPCLYEFECSSSLSLRSLSNILCLRQEVGITLPNDVVLLLELTLSFAPRQTSTIEVSVHVDIMLLHLLASFQ
jgi:hypothetical protein